MCVNITAVNYALNKLFGGLKIVCVLNKSITNWWLGGVMVEEKARLLKLCSLIDWNKRKSLAILTKSENCINL